MPTTSEIMDTVDNSAHHYTEEAVTASGQTSLPPVSVDTADAATILAALVSLGLVTDDT